MTDDGEPLRGKVIAVPESRQLEVFASLLERRGATVVRCPLMTIRDAEDERAVVAWIERMIAAPPELVVFYTGEGIERLVAFAVRVGLDDPFVSALGRTSTLTRGPKPKRALRALGLSATIEAPEPTTAGIVRALETLALDGRRIGVQLYAAEPPKALVDHCTARRIDADFVAPYRYENEAGDDDVVRLIERLARREIDAIAFTSAVQVDRLFKVAAARALEPALRRGLAAARVAAVGPIVAAALDARGLRVDVVPHDSFHLKPLVNALIDAFAGNA